MKLKSVISKKPKKLNKSKIEYELVIMNIYYYQTLRII